MNGSSPDLQMVDIVEQPIKLYLLGPPLVTWQGTPLELPRRQARAILYRLAIDLQPASRSELAFLLWPDAGEALARQNFSRLLNYIRRALPPGAIITPATETVCLSAAYVWSDSHAFLGGADAGTAALERAVSLYRGPFLAGVALPSNDEFERWLQAQQQRFERLYLGFLSRLIQVKREAGDIPAAIDYAQQYLATDELCEEVQYQLIALYVSNGDHGAARRQYERFASILQYELGMQPSPSTQALLPGKHAATVSGEHDVLRPS